MGSTVSKTSGSNNINAVYSDKKDNAEMTSKDFLAIFVKQLQNQDFSNPMDSSEMMNQITQFSNMQMMQEMANYSKSNYAISLVGKTVTASRNTVSGDTETTTGVVQKVAIEDKEYVFYINGKKFTLDQIGGIQSESSGSQAVDASTYKVSAVDTTTKSVSIKWSVPTEDSALAANLKYTVYYSQTGPFDTLADVKKGTVFGTAGQKNLTSEEITGLESGKSYYVNVVVEDAKGNQSIYKPTLVVTK